MVKLCHDIPMGALFYAHPAGRFAFFQYSLLMKHNNNYNISTPLHKEWKYYHTQKGTLPSTKRTGCQKLHIMKI